MRKNAILASVLGFSLMLPASLFAQDLQDGQTIFAATKSQIVKVDRWTVCRMVDGQDSNAVMIPTRAAGEWIPTEPDSFLGTGAKGTLVHTCMATHPALMSGGTAVATYCAANPGAFVSLRSGYTSPGGYGSSGHNPAAISRNGQFMMVDPIRSIGAFVNGSSKSVATFIFDNAARRRCNNGSCLFATGYGSATPIQQISLEGVPGSIYSKATVFSPDGMQFISLNTLANKSYTLDVGTAHEFPSISADIFGITQDPSTGTYSVTRLTPFSLPANTVSRQSVAYSFVKFGFGGRLFFRERVIGSNGKVISNTLKEYLVQAGSYTLSNQLALPDDVDLVNISDDGSEVLAYDEKQGDSYTYIRDPNSGGYVLSQTIKSVAGSLAPKILAPGGTTAIGYESPERASCYRKKVGRDDYTTVCTGKNAPGKVAVYTKNFPDDPTWTKVAQNDSFYPFIERGDPLPASASGTYYPDLSTDGKYLLFYKENTFLKSSSMSYDIGITPTVVSLPDFTEVPGPALVDDFMPEFSMNVVQTSSNGHSGGGNYATYEYNLYYKCQ